MSVILMATADAGLLNSIGSGTVSSDYARTGTYSFKCTNYQLRSFFLVESSGTIYIRFAWYRSSVGSQGNNMYFRLREGSTIHCQFLMNYAGGTLNVYRGTTLIATSTNLTLSVDTWYVVEAKVVIHDTAGSIEVKVNGATVAFNNTLTNVDTRNGSTGLIDNFEAYSEGVNYVDDILVDDANWPGLGGLHILASSGAGTHQDWTGSLPTLTTDAEVTGTKHTFTKDALPANAVNVSAAGVVTTARVTGQGYGALKPLLGAAEGAVVAQSVSSQYNLQLFNGPWTPTAFDALEVGVASA